MALNGEKHWDETEPMEALQLAGQMIMENGGETYRAEETVCRMGEGFGLRDVESFAVPSGLFISYKDEEQRLESSVKRVHRGSFNLYRVDEVNRVSRHVAEGQMTLADSLKRLREIRIEAGPFRGAWSVLSAAVCAGGFAVLFGGRWAEIAVSAVAAALVHAVCLAMNRVHSSWMAPQIVGGFLTALLPHVLSLFFPLQVEAAIAGALMPLVPGIAMTNAVQDTMRGDMVSGISHGVEALLTACLIAGGAILSPSAAMLAARLALGGAAAQAAVPTVPLAPWAEGAALVAGAFCGTLGFAGLAHVPMKTYLPSGGVAAVSFLVYWTLGRVGVAEPVAVFCGALVGAIMGHLLARGMRTIHTVFLMAAIVPVVPGLGLYRMMAFLGQGAISSGASMGLQAMITIAMLALGLSMGGFLDRVLHPAPPLPREVSLKKHL